MSEPITVAVTYRYEVTNLDKAAYDTVHDFPGRAAAVAEMAGFPSATVVSNLVNPNNNDHKLGLKQSIPIQLVTHDFRILHAYAAALGHIAIKLPDAPSYSDVELLDAYTDLKADIGQTDEAIRTLLANGITDHGLAEVHREMHEDFSKALVLFARLKTLSKPSSIGGALS